jgi:D-glycero-D-manno-heptose 1,7-bisphosphate phosphatase
MARGRFVVLDRDGTINVERYYLADPNQLELIPGVVSALRQLRKMDLGLIVITNQSGVGRGFFDQLRLDLIHRRLHKVLRAEGVGLDGIYACPHSPEDDCPCRKPKTGLLELAAKELDFNPQASFVIGDKACDIEMGQRVGATTFLVRTGHDAQMAVGMTATPDFIVDDLWAAAQGIKGLLGRPGWIGQQPSIKEQRSHEKLDPRHHRIYGTTTREFAS